MLTLSEELLLFGLTRRKNAVFLPSSFTFSYALAGALILELMLRGRLKIVQTDKLFLLDLARTEDERLNWLITSISVEQAPKRLPFWITRLTANRNLLLTALQDRLFNKGILQISTRRYFGFFHPLHFTASGESYASRRKQALRAILLRSNGIDDLSLILMGLLQVCNLLDHIFSQDEIPVALSCIDKLIHSRNNGDLIEAVTDGIRISASTALMVSAVK